MPKSAQLLKHISDAVDAIRRTTSNPEHDALLNGIEAALNELRLQDNPDFYLAHIRRGKALVDSAAQLLDQRELSVVPIGASDLHADIRIEVLNAAIDALQRQLAHCAEQLDTDDEQSIRFLKDASGWQAAGYLHRLTAEGGAEAQPPSSITREALSSYLQRRFPHWRHLEIETFRVLDGGFSMKTILFETRDAANGRQAMVIRAEQPVNLLLWDGSDVTKEFHSIRLMQQMGLPVAEPLWLESDASQLGARFLVSRWVSGKSHGGNLGSNEPLSASMIESMLSVLATLHGVRLCERDPLVAQSHFAEWLPFKSVEDATRYYVTDFMEGLMERSAIQVTPQAVYGLRWLRRNVPRSDEAPAIVHIDFALNNVLFEGDRVAAVLDWESSRIGDPAEDVVWTQENLSQLPMPEFLARYSALTGRELTPYRLAYARVAKCMLNLIVCQRGLELIDSDEPININLCTLGLKYPGYFASRLSSLIDAAENARRSAP